MHNALLLLLGAVAAAVAALAGCGAAEPTDPAGQTGLSFLLNGERWTANTEVQAGLTGYGLQVFGQLRFDDRFPLRQQVGFSVPLSEWDGAGTYPTALRSVDDDVYVATIYELDGDALVASYKAVGASAERGGLEVVRYDPATGDIEGRFEGTFVVDADDRGQPLRELPDTLRVTDGRFRAVVEDRR